MTDTPKWRRRKEARPSDICTAALQVFAEKGFAGARIEEIARRAGLSKGGVYLYFPTKEALFRAVVRDAVAHNIEAIRQSVLATPLPFADLVRMLLPQVEAIITTVPRSEEHTSELQSLMRRSYAGFCLKNKN